MNPETVDRLRQLYVEHDELEAALVALKRQGAIHGITWTLTWRYHDLLERRIVAAQAAATPEERATAEAGPQEGA